MARVDVAIIGTGPAGLSAAITAKIRNKSMLLFGSKDSSEKVQKAHAIQNYLGLPNVAGADLQKAFLDHIASMDIEIKDEKITMVMPMGEYFSLQGANEIYEATTVILAAGTAPNKTYPGEEEFLGRGVSYCATCDAALYKGKTVVIIGSSPKEEAEADFMTEYASSVTYIPLYRDEVHLKDEVEVLREIPQRIEGKMKATTLVTNAGAHEYDGIFILRESMSPVQLVPGLEMEDGHVKVDRGLHTNVPGLFAAGDITGAPYQYAKATGEGNVAILSAVSYIDRLKREKSN